MLSEWTEFLYKNRYMPFISNVVLLQYDCAIFWCQHFCSVCQNIWQIVTFYENWNVLGTMDVVACIDLVFQQYCSLKMYFTLRQIFVYSISFCFIANILLCHSQMFKYIGLTKCCIRHYVVIKTCVDGIQVISDIKTLYAGYRISFIKIGRSWDRLIFIMGISVLIILHIYFDMGPW